MKILITGGAGFIASHITDAYIKKGHQVLVVDNLSSGSKQNLNPKAEFEEVDINSKKLESVIKKFQPEIINHHAAQINVRTSVENPKLDAQINILGLLNLMQATVSAGSVKKIILASTGGAIYGDNDTIPTPETFSAWPVSPYGIAKLSSEHYLHFYSHQHQIPYLALRYGNVYGPRQNPHGEAGVVAIFFQKYFEKKEFIINGDGNQTRDYIFVGDVVDANLKATDSQQTGAFNIGASRETSVNQLVEAMKLSINDHTGYRHGPVKPGEQKRSCLDFSKAQKKLGWQPQTSIEEGIAKTAEYFRNMYQ